MAGLMACCMAMAPAHASAAAPAACGNALARMHRQPAHLIYEGCAFLPKQQGKPLRATYHVSGKHAAAVEAYLAKAFGLKRLKLSCCQWDGPAAQFRDTDGRDVAISMVSEETLVAARSGWPSIGAFAVIVEIYTEEI